MLASLTIDHASKVKEIADHSFSVKWSEKDFSYFLCHTCSFCLGFFNEGALIGYLVGLLVQGELDLASVAVLPEERQKKVGKRLLTAAQNHTFIQQIVLEVESTNQAAIRLYESCGFTRVGIRPKYYQGKNDAVRMLWKK